MTRDEQHDGDWRDLWQRYGAKLLLFARQQTTQVSDAEDIVQEAFVRYWKSRRSDGTLAPVLLFTLVRRVAIDHGRMLGRRRSREAQACASWDDQAYFDTGLEDRERAEMVQSSLKSLPDSQREVIVLKIWGELTFQEIGQVLEVSANTAASRYRYALNQLKGLLSPSLQ